TCALPISTPNVGVNLPNTSFSYNVSGTLSFGTGVGNVDNYNVAADLVNVGSADKVYQLKPASAIKTAASDGGEVGAFGGDTPYIISGIPPIPAILSMTNSATG